MCDFAVNIRVNCVFYINICCFSFILAIIRQLLHRCKATDPAFFDGSQKSHVGYGHSPPNAYKEKIWQFLSTGEQETTVHADTICTSRSKLFCHT